MSTDNYESGFAAPPHTIVGIHHDGMRRMTEVILDGELVTFEIDETTHRAAAALADGNDEGDSLTWQM